MSARVHRGYDKEPQEKGSTIKISKPGTFLAKDAPSADQDLTPGDTEIRLDRWREVKFSVSDKELAYAGEKIITDHIRPAAYALSNDIDLSLNGLAKSVPWFYNAAATTEVKDLTRVHQVLFNNKVPMNDSLLHLEVGGDLQAGFLELFANSSFAGASSQEVHKSGHIGNRLGFEIFGNQNVGSHVKGTASVATLAVNGAVQKGATSLNLDATAVNGTLVAGDSFSIAGDPQRYVVAATLTAAGNAFSGVQVFPPLAQDAPDNAVVKMDLTNHVENLAFHRNAFALGMAPLSELGNEFGRRWPVWLTKKMDSPSEAECGTTATTHASKSPLMCSTASNVSMQTLPANSGRYKGRRFTLAGGLLKEHKRRPHEGSVKRVV